MDATINGALIHYERAGAGLPVIFLHAGIADLRMWGPQATAFTKDFEVIRLDQRGFGQSELPPVSWSPVEDLLAIMDELSLKPAHLVGCSMGGALAIDFALEHPERLSKLVLVGSAVHGLEVALEVEDRELPHPQPAEHELELVLVVDGVGPHRSLPRSMGGRARWSPPRSAG